MGDLLSQEQIDNLLKQNGDGGFEGDDIDTGFDEPADVSSGSDFNSLQEAFSLFNENVNSVISQVLNREVTFSVSQCENTNQETLQGNVTAPLLSLTIPFEEGVTGKLFIIISTKDVAIFSDLMMMGDGTSEYKDEHNDAIGELFNQIMGSYTTALGERCDGSISTGAIEVKEFDFDNPPFPFDDTDMLIEDVTISEIGDTHINIVVDRELSGQLSGKFKEPGGADAGGEQLSGIDMGELGELGDFDNEDSEPSADLGSAPSEVVDKNVDMLLDVELDVYIELGSTNLSIKRILELAPGSIVELERMAGEPVDLMVNNKVIAKGEVVVVDENFGIRIVSLVSTEERIKSLK